MYTIAEGDKVKHKYLLKYNNLLMLVTEIEDEKIYCEYFDSTTKETIQTSFNLNEIELVEKVEGGFVN